MVPKGWRLEEMGKCWSKSTKSQLNRKNMPRDLIYSVMTIVNNVLKNGNMLRK